jgi:hypothetical protein
MGNYIVQIVESIQQSFHHYKSTVRRDVTPRMKRLRALLERETATVEDGQGLSTVTIDLEMWDCLRFVRTTVTESS